MGGFGSGSCGTTEFIIDNIVRQIYNKFADVVSQSQEHIDEHVCTRLIMYWRRRFIKKIQDIKPQKLNRDWLSVMGNVLSSTSWADLERLESNVLQERKNLAVDYIIGLVILTCYAPQDLWLGTKGYHSCGTGDQGYAYLILVMVKSSSRHKS